MRPLLTVIVPAYNCAGYLDECLESVLGQLPEDCELVAVDDGSPDGTPEILASYEKAYGNMKALYCAHKGTRRAQCTSRRREP